MTIPARILHLIDTGGPGGAETVLATIVESLPGTRWRSRVLVPKDDWLLNRLREGQVDARVLTSGRAADLRYLSALVHAVREFRPALIHAHLLTSGVYGSLAAGLCGRIPLLCTFHGKPDVAQDDRLLWLKARILARARNRIVYVSHDLRHYLEPLLGIPENIGVTIHNGVAFVDPAPSEPARLERGAGARTRPFVVGAVGNIREPKDYPNLLRAAAIVCRQRSDVQFVIAGGGGGHLLTELEEMAKDLGISERLQFLGFRHDVASVVSGFDLFVSSSSSEGLPLSTLEAMGMGKAVVLTRCGGPAEIVDDGRTGILVPPRDPRALAMGILTMLADPERRRALGRAGKLEVRTRFAKEGMLANYEGIYGTLIRHYPVLW